MLQGCIGTDTLNYSWDLLFGFAQQFTLDSSWCDAIDRSAIFAQLMRQVARHRFEASFACSVDSQTTERLPCGERTDVDDTSWLGKIWRRSLDH